MSTHQDTMPFEDVANLTSDDGNPQTAAAVSLTSFESSNRIFYRAPQDTPQPTTYYGTTRKIDRPYIDLTHDTDSEIGDMVEVDEVEVAESTEDEVFVSLGIRAATPSARFRSDSVDTEPVFTNKRTRETLAITESDDSSDKDNAPTSKKVRFCKAHEANQVTPTTCYQALAPPVFCMHRPAGNDDNVLPQHIPQSQSHGPCIVEYAKGYSAADDIYGNPSVVILSRECIGFRIRAGRLHTGSRLLNAAALQYKGFICIPEPEQIVKFLVDCMASQSVAIDVDLAGAVAENGYPSTFCGVLVRLHGIAEEFQVDRAMKLVVNLLVQHAASNPLLALGFALRSKRVNVELAYEALCHFSQAEVNGCTEEYWATVARARQQETQCTQKQAAQWQQTAQEKFEKSLRNVFGHHAQSLESHLWPGMAADFLDGMGCGEDAQLLLAEKGNEA